MIRRALVAVLPLLVICACSSSPPCLDGGVDAGCGGSGGGGGGGSGSVDPSVDHSWDVFLDDFSATSDVTDLSYTSATCSVTGGPAHAVFSPAAGAVGTKIGSIVWSTSVVSADKGSFEVSVPMTSNGSMGAQNGTGAGGIAAHCDAYTSTDTASHTVHGKFTSLTGNATLSATCPINPIVGGNIGCPPNGDSCRLQFGFDGSASPHLTNPFSMASAVSGASFTITFSGSSTTRQTSIGTSAGNYAWSGTVKLHAVPTP